MTDYVITNGRSAGYPTVHYGGHHFGDRATYCEPADFVGFSDNVLAIPNLPITVLSSTPVTVDESFFGTHIYYRANDSLLPSSYKTVRIHDMQGGKARWQFIQPTSTTWDWVDLDRLVNTHYNAGRELIFSLYGTPSWASARPTEDTEALKNAYSSYIDGVWYNRGIAAEPSDMTKWDAFCSAVATRYKGKIKYYEVWNEPNHGSNGTAPNATNFYFSGTFAKLAEMVRRANQAIKLADPAAKIISPNVQGWTATSGASDTYFTGMMAAATGDGSTTMKDWVDIIGVHLYLPTSNKIQDLAGMIDRINASKTTAGVSALPTWDTESSMESQPAGSYLDPKVVTHIKRFLLTCAAKGIARSNWYQWDRLDGYGIKHRSQVIEAFESTRSLLLSGAIQAAYRFTDGRVGYYTANGLTII